MNGAFFEVDTNKLEDLKSEINSAHGAIRNSIDGIDNAISSMGSNSWEGPDYEIFREDFVNRKSDLNAAESYIKAYESLVDTVIESATDLATAISDACTM